MKKYLLLLSCLFLLAACGQPSGKKGEVVAKVDSEVITTADVESKINAMPPPYREFFKQPEAMSDLIDQIVSEELLVVAAKKKGMDKDEDYTKSVEDFKKRELITRLLKKDLPAMPQLTEKDVKDYYDSHKSELMQINAVRLSQIVVKTEDDAKKVYERLQKGEAFGKVASEVSIDKATAKSGGDMGFLSKDQISPDFAKAISSLKKGQVGTTPVSLKDGLHIIIVTDVKGTSLDFEKIKSALAQQVMATKQKEVIDKYLDGLKKEHKVELKKENFSKVNLEAPKPAAPAKAEAPAKPADTAPVKAAEKAPEKAPEKK
jgi:peptidyl-prolyl cis-trans isomerase C